MSLRLILIVIGALIIVAILLDGYRHWRRAHKQNKITKERRYKEPNEPHFSKPLGKDDLEVMPRITLDDAEPTFDDVLFSRKKPSVFDEPIIAPPTLELPDTLAKTIDTDEVEPIFPIPAPAAPSSPIMPVKDNIVVLHVLAELDRYFSGEDLRAKFAAYNLLYGPMHIYHKYENTDGSGAILFSVANAFEPGTLNLEYPESFYTRGLTFFMQTSNKANPLFSFETMLNTATALAKSFNARLCDHQRQPLTVTTAQDYRNQVQGIRD